MDGRSMEERFEGRVRLGVEAGVAEVTLSRPEAHNGLDWAMIDGLLAAQRRLAALDGLRAVVLAGEGESFCAGLDMGAIMGQPARLPSLLVPARGGRHVETLTGFKWLVRAGEPLRYAYEEAIGHCVLPDVVADKDGISAAAAWCAMVGSGGPSVGARLDSLAAEFGAHLRRNVALPLAAGVDPTAALERAAGLLGDVGEVGEVGVVRDLEGTTGFRVDSDGARAVVRPSGTEPLLKTYVEAWTPPAPSAADLVDAERRLALLGDSVAGAVGG